MVQAGGGAELLEEVRKAMTANMEAFFKACADDEGLQAKMHGVSGALADHATVPEQLRPCYDMIHALLGTTHSESASTPEAAARNRQAEQILWQTVFLRNPTRLASVDWAQVAFMLCALRSGATTDHLRLLRGYGISCHSSMADKLIKDLRDEVGKVTLLLFKEEGCSRMYVLNIDNWDLFFWESRLRGAVNIVRKVARQDVQKIMDRLGPLEKLSDFSKCACGVDACLNGRCECVRRGQECHPSFCDCTCIEGDKPAGNLWTQTIESARKKQGRGRLDEETAGVCFDEMKNLGKHLQYRDLHGIVRLIGRVFLSWKTWTRRDRWFGDIRDVHPGYCTLEGVRDAEKLLAVHKAECLSFLQLCGDMSAGFQALEESGELAQLEHHTPTARSAVRLRAVQAAAKSVDMPLPNVSDVKDFDVEVLHGLLHHLGSSARSYKGDEPDLDYVVSKICKVHAQHNGEAVHAKFDNVCTALFGQVGGERGAFSAADLVQEARQGPEQTEDDRDRGDAVRRSNQPPLLREARKALTAELRARGANLGTRAYLGFTAATLMQRACFEYDKIKREDEERQDTDDSDGEDPLLASRTPGKLPPMTQHIDPKTGRAASAAKHTDLVEALDSAASTMGIKDSIFQQPPTYLAHAFNHNSELETATGQRCFPKRSKQKDDRGEEENVPDDASELPPREGSLVDPASDKLPADDRPGRVYETRESLQRRAGAWCGVFGCRGAACAHDDRQGQGKCAGAPTWAAVLEAANSEGAQAWNVVDCAIESDRNRGFDQHLNSLEGTTKRQLPPPEFATFMKREPWGTTRVSTLTTGGALSRFFRPQAQEMTLDEMRQVLRDKFHTEVNVESGGEGGLGGIILMIADYAIMQHFEDEVARGQISNVIFVITTLHFLLVMMDLVSDQYWDALNLKYHLTSSLNLKESSAEAVAQSASKHLELNARAYHDISVAFMASMFEDARSTKRFKALCAARAAEIETQRRELQGEASPKIQRTTTRAEAEIFSQYLADTDWNREENTLAWVMCQFSCLQMLMSNMLRGCSNGCHDMVVANYISLCPWLFTSDTHHLKQKEAVSMLASLEMLSEQAYQTYKRRAVSMKFRGGEGGYECAGVDDPPAGFMGSDFVHELIVKLIKMRKPRTHEQVLKIATLLEGLYKVWGSEYAVRKTSGTSHHKVQKDTAEFGGNVLAVMRGLSKAFPEPPEDTEGAELSQAQTQAGPSAGTRQRAFARSHVSCAQGLGRDARDPEVVLLPGLWGGEFTAESLRSGPEIGVARMMRCLWERQRARRPTMSEVPEWKRKWHTFSSILQTTQRKAEVARTGQDVKQCRKFGCDKIGCDADHAAERSRVVAAARRAAARERFLSKLAVNEEVLCHFVEPEEGSSSEADQSVVTEQAENWWLARVRQVPTGGPGGQGAADARVWRVEFATNEGRGQTRVWDKTDYGEISGERLRPKGAKFGQAESQPMDI